MAGVKKNRVCEVEGCTRKHLAKGFCNYHYYVKRYDEELLHLHHANDMLTRRIEDLQEEINRLQRRLDKCICKADLNRR